MNHFLALAAGRSVELAGQHIHAIARLVLAHILSGHHLVGVPSST